MNAFKFLQKRLTENELYGCCIDDIEDSIAIFIQEYRRLLTKEQIKEHWERVLKVQFYLVEKGIDEEGWYSNQRNDQWLPLQGDTIKMYDFRNENTEVRPKSIGLM